MMLYGLCALLLVGVAMADDCGCSTEDKHEVQTMWSSIWGAQFTGRRVAIGQAVFAELFKNHPESKALFARVNADNPDSPEFKAHVIRVINGLDVTISLLADPGVLDKHLAHLHTQHAARAGVHAEHFKYIGEAFQAVLPRVATCFNPQAFEHCFKRITDGIAHGLA